MKQRGRKSKDELAIALPGGSARRIKPRPDLEPEAARVFRELVASCDASHFRESDWPLLESYARAIVLERQAHGWLKEAGAVIGMKPNPWLVVAEKAGRQIVACATKLRLAPQARADPKTVARQTSEPGTNISDWVRLNEDDDGED